MHEVQPVLLEVFINTVKHRRSLINPCGPAWQYLFTEVTISLVKSVKLNNPVTQEHLATTTDTGFL